MKANKLLILMMSVITAIVFAGCTSSSNNNNGDSMEDMDHTEMNHSGSSELPNGLQEAGNPTYKVGSTVILNSDHMEGMNGAEATITGAYETTVYSVSYTPTTGGEKVTNHKWVVHEEMENAAQQPYKPVAEVTLAADHLKGMAGAKATIDSAEQTTVYVVDYIPIDGGDKVKNHKWVTDSELSPSE